MTLLVFFADLETPALKPGRDGIKPNKGFHENLPLFTSKFGDHRKAPSPI
jgi:hypothetical protein